MNSNYSMPPKSKPVRNGVIVDSVRDDGISDMVSDWGFSSVSQPQFNIPQNTNYSNNNFSMPSDISSVSVNTGFDADFAMQSAMNEALIKEAQMELRAERDDESILAAFGESDVSTMNYDEIEPGIATFYSGEIPHNTPLKNVNMAAEEKKNEINKGVSNFSNEDNLFIIEKIGELESKIDFLIKRFEDFNIILNNLKSNRQQEQNVNSSLKNSINTQFSKMNLGELIRSKKNKNI